MEKILKSLYKYFIYMEIVENSILFGKIIFENSLKPEIKEIISKLAEQAEEGSITGWRCLAVNSPIFQKEIGEILIEKAPVSIVYWYNFKNELIMQFQSKIVDVSKIVKIWGGVGIKQIANLTLDSLYPRIWELGTPIYGS